jgi:hypothetical protein
MPVLLPLPDIQAYFPPFDRDPKITFPFSYTFAGTVDQLFQNHDRTNLLTFFIPELLQKLIQVRISGMNRIYMISTASTGHTCLQASHLTHRSVITSCFS